MSSNAYWLWWNESNKHMCVAVSVYVVVGCCRYGVGALWRLAKLSNCGLVWSWMAGVELDGLCEERWSRWTWRLMRSRWAHVVEHADLCEVVDVVQLGELSRSSSLSVSRNGKCCLKSPSTLSTRCRSCSTPSRSKSIHNQWQLLGSSEKDKPPYFEISFVYGGESQFCLGTSQFRVAWRSMPFRTLCIIFSWLISVVSREVLKIQSVLSIVSLKFYVLSYQSLLTKCVKSILLASNTTNSDGYQPSFRLIIGLSVQYKHVPAGFFHPPHGRGPVWNVAGLVSVGIHG